MVTLAAVICFDVIFSPIAAFKHSMAAAITIQCTVDLAYTFVPVVVMGEFFNVDGWHVLKATSVTALCITIVVLAMPVRALWMLAKYTLRRYVDQSRAGSRRPSFSEIIAEELHAHVRLASDELHAHVRRKKRYVALYVISLLVAFSFLTYDIRMEQFHNARYHDS